MNPLYSRHFALKDFSEVQQKALENARVFIIGCGGLGNLASVYLSTAGIGELCINDFDTVDVSNLQRQLLFNTTDIKQKKAIVAKDKLSKLNSECRIEAITKRLSLEELRVATKGFDLILDCSDNFATRLNVNQVSVDNKIPLVSGAAIRYEGQISFYNPTQANSPCYRCLHQTEDESIEDCAGNGIFAPVTGVIASSMAIEAMKYLTNIGDNLMGRLQLYDAKVSSWREIKLNKDSHCPVCSIIIQ